MSLIELFKELRKGNVLYCKKKECRVVSEKYKKEPDIVFENYLEYINEYYSKEAHFVWLDEFGRLNVRRKKLWEFVR